MCTCWVLYNLTDLEIILDTINLIFQSTVIFMWILSFYHVNCQNPALQSNDIIKGYVTQSNVETMNHLEVVTSAVSVHGALLSSEIKKPCEFTIVA